MTALGDGPHVNTEQVRGASAGSVVRHGRETTPEGAGSPSTSPDQQIQPFTAPVRPAPVLDETTNRRTPGPRMPLAEPSSLSGEPYDTLYELAPPFQYGSLVEDPFHRSSTTVPVMNNPFTLGLLAEPYVLVPHVVVTPQRRAVDDRTRSIWAAVEVTTQLSRPGAAGWRSDQAWLHNRRLSQRYIQENSPSSYPMFHQGHRGKQKELTWLKAVRVTAISTMSRSNSFLRRTRPFWKYWGTIHHPRMPRPTRMSNTAKG